MKNSTCRISTLFLFAVMLLTGGCAEPQKLRVVFPPPPDEPRMEFIAVMYSQDDFPKGGAGRAARNILGSTAQDRFKTPAGIASDGKGRVYIADIHDRNVKVFDFNDRSVNYLMKQTIFHNPAGLAVDADGRLYVGDVGSGKIFVFDPHGNPLYNFSDNALFEKPSYLAINNALGRLYVSDGKRNKIIVFDLQGNHLFTFGEGGDGEGELYGPQGLAIDKEGRVFVPETLNARISVFDADGKFLYKFGNRGDQVWQFESPKACAFDSEGNLHVLDQRKAAIFTYQPDGKLLLFTGAGKATSHVLGFGSPMAISIDAGDRIYIADALEHRFSIWQYLSKGYLAKHPLTEEDIALIQKSLKGKPAK
jgi:DNA-binding beta-propeller fold protein YncE